MYIDKLSMNIGSTNWTKPNDGTAGKSPDGRENA